ncbi:MAG TPA: protein kinase [Myxococcaceae bacterium]|nr:protein kinase [Myxococcaceae bacterium]
MLSHYRLEELLASGGMGVLYRATDLKLGRAVAIKLLAPHLVADEAAKVRFVHEARAASALDHPNIGTIYEIGEDQGELFIAMALYEGETLKQRLEKGRFAVDDALPILREVALGLEAAHRAGIIHRDIKPANILLTSAGAVKILDFGLAKLATDSPAQALTQAGQAMGTVLYMSPEQLRGQAVDGRSDLWSFGVVAYELLAGVAPFAAESGPATAMRILGEEPPPLAGVPGVPDWLAALVTELLRKMPDQRPQSASEVLRRLERPASPSHPEARPHRAPLLSGKRLIPVAVGVAAVVAATLFYFRGRAQALTERDSILLAELDNTTGDPVFDGTLRQALAVKLEESPFLNVAPDERIRETLRLMGRTPEQRLDTATTREVCQRQGAKAMLGGSIAALGSHYVIYLNAVNCRTGDSLARDQTEAESKEKVLGVLGKAASRIRGKLGESLGSVQKFDVPIEQATTSSLEALKAYTAGLTQHLNGDISSAITLYQRAAELDPNFAMAYGRLGAVFGIFAETTVAAEYAKKAFGLRDRVSERERLYLSASYYRLVTGELEKAIEIYDLWKQSYPRDFTPYNNEAVTYADLGQNEKALERSREAVEVEPTLAIPQIVLGQSFVALGRLAEAKSVFEKVSSPKMENPAVRGALFEIAFLEGDSAAMQRHAAWFKGKPMESFITVELARVEMLSGRARKAAELLSGAVEDVERRGLKEGAVFARGLEALYLAEVGSDRLARERALAAAQGVPSARGQWVSALALARAGDVDRARAIAEQLSEKHPLDTMLVYLNLPSVQAAIEINQGNAAKAVQLLKSGSPYELTRGSWSPMAYWAIYLRGQAYLRQRAGIEAAAEFQKILDHHGIDPISPLHALAHLGLGRAWALAGDHEKARRAYQDFLALWKDADADLPILQQAKAEYAKLN